MLLLTSGFSLDSNVETGTSADVLFSIFSTLLATLAAIVSESHAWFQANRAASIFLLNSNIAGDTDCSLSGVSAVDVVILTSSGVELNKLPESSTPCSDLLPLKSGSDDFRLLALVSLPALLSSSSWKHVTQFD